MNFSALCMKVTDMSTTEHSLLNDLEKLPESAELPVEDLRLKDKDLAALLKGLNTRQDMLKKLEDEENRIRSLAKQTDADRELFEKVHDFRMRLSAAPESWVPRPVLDKVAPLLNGLFNMKLTKESVALKLEEKKAQALAAQHAAEEKVRTIGAEANVKKLEEALAAFQQQNGDEPVDKTFPGWTNATLMTYRATQADNYKDTLSNPPTKKEITEALQHAINTMKAAIRDAQNHKKEAADFDAALKQLATDAKDWPKDQILCATPKLPQYVLDELKRTGRRPTQEAVNAIVQKRFKEHNAITSQYGKEERAIEEKLEQLPGNEDLNKLAEFYGDAERTHHETHPNKTRYPKNREGFLEVMGHVVGAHKIQAGWAVGVGTAIKAMFS